ncbi:MAG: hypothetical protein WDZ28_06050 [Simkaniaceae bacterium]
MAKRTSQRRARNISTALFLIGLATISYNWNFWPNILIVIGAPLAIRQYLTGRIHDMIVTIIIFGGIYITDTVQIHWNLILPVILITAAIYVLFREFLDSRADTEVEQEEDLNVEIEIEEYRNEK